MVDVGQSPELDGLVDAFWELRQRKGITRTAARALLLDPIYFGAMMVQRGFAAGMVGGPGRAYSDTLRPALQILGVQPGHQKVSGVYAMLFKDRQVFFGDCTVNVEPDAESLAEIALNTASVAERFGVRPRVAMLSYSDFGEHGGDPRVARVREAVRLVRKRRPNLEIDGEMQADTAVDYHKVTASFPFSRLDGPANVLVFPDLTSGNIAYKLLANLSTAEVLGPLLAGIAAPVNVVPVEGNVSDVVNIATYTANQALDRSPGTQAGMDYLGLSPV